ncbi:hypothetical protein CWI42_081440 [Ordospora colligata]|uniref:Uncharacterized protein n=1 Tax=Ordospora colligata OC4 TaxID=1354746 RepID=A0A0B2UK32_9MICR|nr:uncharacterized protein M896_081440 [Ordospora colligata OC4]KHN69407.1 hypothetical protein M896_081440 [Ordospora colligata OC4]TBU14921.1 hypothetical protein CWI41_081430 [Ordospora colligata]TBU15052.1 hypothetical protein CWI40_081450 [Ordospora colligata]TBU18306.1 hypothetical protein CWI42_081440 [Ordospora colligata]
MLYELLFVAVVLILCFSIINNKRKELNGKVVLLRPFIPHFTRTISDPVSVHQHGLKFIGHDVLVYLCSIITLKRDFCPTYILGTVPNESLTLIGCLKTKAPCMYAFKKTITPKHYGLKYVKKYLVESTPQYKVFGSPEKKHIDFLKKYNDISSLWISYVPESIDNGYIDSESQVYLKGKLRLLEDKEFIDDFMSLFDNTRNELEKKITDVRRGCNNDVQKVNTKKNMSISDKIMQSVKNRESIRK